MWAAFSRNIGSGAQFQGSMTVREYCLKFNQLAKYAPDLVADNRASMNKIKERDRMRGNKRARSKQHGQGQTRSQRGSRPQYQDHLSMPVPSSASAPVPRGQGLPNEVSHPMILRWLATKSKIKIKEVDLFNPSNDTVVHPWIMPTEQELGITSFITLGIVDTIADPMMELIKKELVRATAIRIAVKQGQPSVEVLHNQSIATNLGTSFGGVAGGVVDVGGKHADAIVIRYVEHVDAQEKINKFENTHYTEILCLIRDRKLVYPKAYDVVDRIMDLDFYKKLKDRQNDLSKLASTLSGEGFGLLLFGFQWYEEIIKYVRGERPNPHDKSWTKAKRILGVMNMDDIYYRVVEILLKEGKIKVYDYNLLALDEADFFTHMQPLLELFPILLRQSKLMDRLPMEVLIKQPSDFEGRNKDVDLPKNEIIAACRSHALAHIECLLIDTKMAEPMKFLCDNAVVKIQEVWAYGVLTGCLEPVYKEKPVK
ncbi:hypothetical protein FXO38_25045 [Capsicum annuum]|nr:hypothetical protein FXO38_25045 [Capsicum annuum]